MMSRWTVVAAVVLVSSLARADLDWWKVGPVYQIFPASFADSDGNGIGDLNGITGHAEYFQDIGVGAVWLSPIYPSPMRDNGYDASNYTDVNPLFGTMADADNLIKAYHDKGIRVILDFVPNHTSNESVWFKDSVNKRNGKDDWYVWRDPKGTDAQGNPMPPNNWRSTFGGSAWKYVAARNQFYYHQFGDYQTDLNYDNPEVVNAMKECIRFWLRKGIDGFRMDAVPYIIETNYQLDEPVICNPDDGSYGCLNHIYTTNMDGTHKVLLGFDEVLREQEFTKTGVRAMWVEAYNDIPELVKYNGPVSSPFNFQYVSNLKLDSNAQYLQKLTMDYYNALNGSWPNVVVGNHDNSRVGTKMGPDMIDSMNIFTQWLPGTSITYYGEEIGMTDAYVPPSRRKDYASNPSRDPERTPMQWNSSRNAGFSTAPESSLYLPINPNDFEINVKKESTSKTPSHLDIYKKAVKLHKKMIETTPALNTTTHGSWVFAAQRPGMLLMMNLNNEEEKLVIQDLQLNKMPDSLKVELASINANFTEGSNVKTSDNITLTPRSTVVFTYNSVSDVHISSLLFSSVCCFIFWRFR